MKFATQHRKSTSFGVCCVSGCDSRVNKDFNLSFHKVPKLGSIKKIRRQNLFGKIEEIDKRSEWLRKLNIKEDDNRKNLLVCSLHFDENDYWFPEIDAKARPLKRDAVPKSFNVQVEKIKKNVQRQKRLDDRRSRKPYSRTNDSMKGKEKKRQRVMTEFKDSIIIPIKKEPNDPLDINCEIEFVAVKQEIKTED